MKDKPFFDTNVLIYALATDDPRAEIAEELLAGGGVVGVQTLNEFVAVAVRKLAMPWEEVLEALNAIRVLCPSPVPVTVETHDTALRIVGQHGYAQNLMQEDVVQRVQQLEESFAADKNSN
jgi:predicted nucleic acid-binding protein